MMKKISIFLMFVINVLFVDAQSNKYFYEFNVPGLIADNEVQKSKKILNEQGIYELRVDKFSKKILCFSEKNISEQEFRDVFEFNSLFVYFFFSGLQGVDNHKNNTIEEWNKLNTEKFSHKDFIVIGKNGFTEIEKIELNKYLRENNAIENVRFSKNNMKIVISTSKNFTKEGLKNLLYSGQLKIKLIDLIEIYL